MPNNKDDKNGLPIRVNEEVAKGVYSNIAMVSHTPAEFCIDFGQVLPGVEGAIIRQRTIIAPIHAKRLLHALAENIEKYESMFGKIVEPDLGSVQMPYDLGKIGKA